MAQKYDKHVYDTAVLVTTGAPKEFFLFKVAKGQDSSHDEDETNNEYAGNIPSKEKMTIHELEFQAAPDVSQTDLQKLLKGSYLEIKQKGNQVFHGPLTSLAPEAGFSGHFELASAGDNNMISLKGNRLKLRNPITLEGGDSYEVRLVQGTNVAVASNLRVVLIAEIERQ